VNSVILGLRGDNRLLSPAQKLPRLGQRQSKIRDISEIAESAEFQNLEASLRPVGARLNQTYNPTHP
jgi:hypothetical protein